MVSQITFFEPHFDDAQFGPTTPTTATLDNSDRSAQEPVSNEDTATSLKHELSRFGIVAGGATIVAGIVGSVVAWRRFQTRRHAERANDGDVQIEKALTDTLASEQSRS